MGIIDSVVKRKSIVARERAEKLLCEIHAAIELLGKLESVAVEGDVRKINPTDCIATSAEIKGFGFVKMTISYEGEILMAKVLPNG